MTEEIKTYTDTQPDVVPNTPASKTGRGKGTRNPASNRKKVLYILGVIVAGYLAYALYVVFFTPDRYLRQIYLVPSDAAIIIQSNDPVGDWKKLSGSRPWQRLMEARVFADISGNVATLDSIIQDNGLLLSMAGRREMTISLHKTRATDFDFLVIVDINKMAKVSAVRDNIEQVLRLAGYAVTSRKYNKTEIVEARNKKTGDILSSAIVDNHFIASFSPRLVEASIDERERPAIGIDHAYMEIERAMAGRGIARMYVNYGYMPSFLSIYLGSNEYVDMLSGAMSYAGLFLSASQQRLELAGNTLPRDGEQNPYVEALLNSGKQKMRAHEIIPARTAFYANFGFENPSTFIRQLESAMSGNDSTAFVSYKSAKDKLEKYLGLSLYDNFLGWMAGEFAFVQTEPGLLGREPEVVLAIKAKDIDEARRNMEIVEKKIKRRTPLNVKGIEYRGFEIKYIEMRGFFRLFFGNLFDKFEKPYYTYVDDYLVLSNKPSSLLSFITDYKDGNLLHKGEEFRNAFSQAEPNSTLFLYMDMNKFYPQLRSLLSVESWRNLQENNDVLLSFPQWTTQMIAGRQSTSIKFIMNYKPIEEAAETETANPGQKADEVIDEVVNEAQTEKELMSELQRFYVEKFEGNILRDYYPDGSLHSESEIRKGKRSGRYREFYEDGKLKVYGKYSDNKPKGTWKYYTPDGKFDHKEKF